MKKLLFILIFTPLFLFAQNNQTVNIRTGKGAAELGAEAKKEEGVFPLDGGKLQITFVGGTGFVSLKKLQKRCDEKIEEYTKLNNLKYKLLSKEERKTGIGIFPKVSNIFQLYTQDGEIYLSENEKNNSKEKAKKDLLELKELLDLGLITQEEFDKKAVSLKKILLGN